MVNTILPKHGIYGKQLETGNTAGINPQKRNMCSASVTEITILVAYVQEQLNKKPFLHLQPQVYSRSN